eukprot:g7399.t1
MSEKYYSTLTNDLAKQYRLALAKRLTNYNPEYRSEYRQLKILTSKESNENLNRMLSLKRPEVFRREQDAALSLVGIKRRKDKKITNSHSGNQLLQRASTSSPTHGRQRRRQTTKSFGKSITTPRYFTSGGGDMTIHHRGRCTYDPKVMSITTPGPQAYSSNTGLVGKSKIKGGSLFGRSKSQRSQLGQASKSRRVSTANNCPSGRHKNRPKLRTSNSAPSSFSQKPFKKIVRKTAPFGTSGPRTHPLAQRNDMIDCAATHEGTDRWSSPGPRYNTRADARYRLPGVPITYGKTTKFSTSSRLPKQKESVGPGPVYQPKYSQVEKKQVNPTMCPRRSYGSLYESINGDNGPGPAYLPKFDNKGHISTAPSFSFGDHDIMVRASRSASNIAPQPSSRSLSRKIAREREERRRRGLQHKPMYQPSKELLAEASITEMRREIWKKIRRKDSGADLYTVMDNR